MKKIWMSIFLFTCVQAFAGDLNPSDASKACAAKAYQSGLFYNVVGHSNTTFKISEFSGRGFRESLILSYFSQYPDEDKNFDAIVNAIKNKIPFAGDQFTQDAVSKLHSLHGGGKLEIKNRRGSLELAIKNNLRDPQNLWKAGLLIHAYADTFAHTMGKYGSNDEIAFGPIVGHLFHTILGDDPDQITKQQNLEKFIAYVNSLFRLIETNDRYEEGFNKFISNVKQSTCNDDMCLRDEILMSHDIKEIEKFEKCMNANMKPLTKQQVQGVMDQIK